MGDLMTFEGILTALVTPLGVDGRPDEARFRQLVRRQLEAGIDGLVPCGTTGEAPTLTIEEHVDIVRWTVEECAGQVPVLAGIGSNDTRQAIETGRRVQALGVQGVLGTAPYYNKPTQEGLYRHFRAISEALDVEVCIYDVPGRASVHVKPETTARLAGLDNISCIKDATGDLNIATALARRMPEGFALLSGDDFTTFPFIAVGGHGAISVASNLVPERMVALMRAARAGRMDEARALHQSLFPLFGVLFIETNPLPIKTALSILGLCEPRFRLPLCPMQPIHVDTLTEIMEQVGAR